MSTTREFRSEQRVTVITETGVDGGPNYVLVHGIGMGHRYWSDLDDVLASTGRVFALDLPGFGDAPEPAETLDMPASGDLLAELIEAEGIKRPILVGHSMGTQIVVEAVARHPHLTDCIVLIAPTVNPRERSAFMQGLRLLQDISLTKPRVMALGIFYYIKAGPRWYFKNLGVMLQHRVELTMPKVRARTLVIRGERDRLTPRSWARQVASLIPDARLVEVKGRGHETMITAGNTVARLIADHAGA